MITINKETVKLFNLTTLALLFLALNSILCKAALLNNYIDAYSFTFLRLFFGAFTLLLIYFYKNKKLDFNIKTNWITSFMLFLYAVSFSYSYVEIEAGFGALLLFGVVQVIMLSSSYFKKEKFTIKKNLGIILAFLGLVYLLFPSENFELSYYHVFLMILAGLSWAVYSILGKSSFDALFDTSDNFIKATIFIVIFYFIIPIDNISITNNGILLAFISGSLTSAIGYVVWYKVLPQIEVFTASIIQLFIPVIAIILSVIFLDEILTFNLLISSIIIFCGILLAVVPSNIR